METPLGNVSTLRSIVGRCERGSERSRGGRYTLSHEREATKSAQSPLQRGRGYASPWKGRWLLGTNRRGGFNDSCESIFSQLSFPESLPRDGSLDDSVPVIIYVHVRMYIRRAQRAALLFLPRSLHPVCL